MPVMTTTYYKCPKCGFITTKSRGDVIYSPTEFSPPTCPKCHIKMREVNESDLNFVGKLIKMFKKK